LIFQDGFQILGKPKLSVCPGIHEVLSKRNHRDSDPLKIVFLLKIPKFDWN